MSLATQITAGFARVATEIKTVKGSITSNNTALTKYRPPIYVLEVGQTTANVPADFPAGGLVFQKTS